MFARGLADKGVPGGGLVAWTGAVERRGGQATLAAEPDAPDGIAQRGGGPAEHFGFAGEQDATGRAQERCLAVGIGIGSGSALA